MLVYLNGLLLGISLVATLGPQNVFLIRQGSQRQHVALSAIVCFLADFILVTGSVVGLHDLLAAHERAKDALTWFGIVFLMGYGIRALKKAVNSSRSLAVKQQNKVTRLQIIVFALGFSLINPHAIIDSLVLIGGGSAQFPGQEAVFLMGVLSSSLLWFTALTMTVYYFSNAISRPSVWRTIEFLGGILMVSLGIKLILSQL